MGPEQEVVQWILWYLKKKHFEAVASNLDLSRFLNAFALKELKKCYLKIE